jgi:hypothetical protein
MKIIKFFLISLISTVLNIEILLADTKKGTKFVLLGHLYPLIKNHEGGLLKLAEKVNSHNPDYIFILGDSKLDEIDVVSKIEKIFKGKIFYSPGYEESNKKRSNYKKNIGYFNKLIDEKDVRFILLDSSEKDINVIKKTLKEYLKKKYTGGPTVLLTHHRIWDDTLIREGHDKNFYFEEIYPTIKSEVNYIFAGNGKRQYFRDLKDNIIYGKQNVNVIFWLDKIGNIDNYAIGMGDGYPKAIFTIAQVLDDKLFITGDFASIADYDILPKNLISPDKHKLSTKYTGGGYFFVNKKKFYLGIFIVLIILSFLYVRKKIKP